MLDLLSVTIQDTLRFDQLRPALVIKAAGCKRGIYAEHSHRPHPLHVPSTDSVTVHGAEIARESANNAIIYDIALSRIPTIDLRFYRL